MVITLAPHPLSAFMNTEAYRHFNYCAGSGEYTAFEVSGNAAVYLTSFTANAPPGVLLWLVDSGSAYFVTPFRDTMILPIRTLGIADEWDWRSSIKDGLTVDSLILRC